MMKYILLSVSLIILQKKNLSRTKMLNESYNINSYRIMYYYSLATIQW